VKYIKPENWTTIVAIIILILAEIVVHHLFNKESFEFRTLSVNPPTETDPIKVSESDIYLRNDRPVRAGLAYLHTDKSANCLLDCSCQPGCPVILLYDSDLIELREGEIHEWVIAFPPLNISRKCATVCSCNVLCEGIMTAHEELFVAKK